MQVGLDKGKKGSEVPIEEQVGAKQPGFESERSQTPMTRSCLNDVIDIVLGGTGSQPT